MNKSRQLFSIVFPIIFFTLIFSSCKKDEGFGGNSSVKGELYEKVYNDDFSQLLFEQPAKDENVFIIFGDDKVIGDDRTTNFNGLFEFDFLFPGSYTIFYYSDDSLSAYNENIEIKHEINLDKREDIDLGRLYLLKNINYNEGNAKIKGQVFLINYLNTSTYPNLVVKDTSYAQEQEIYLTYGNHEFYDDRIRTQYDGTFIFLNLIKGMYKVFLYSEDVSGGTEDIVVMFEIEITDENQSVDLGDIFIEQL